MLIVNHLVIVRVKAFYDILHVALFHLLVDLIDGGLEVGDLHKAAISRVILCKYLVNIFRRRVIVHSSCNRLADGSERLGRICSVHKVDELLVVDTSALVNVETIKKAV